MTDVETSQINPELREWLLDERAPIRSPVDETFPVVGCSRTRRRIVSPPFRNMSEFHGVRSFVVPVEFQERMEDRSFKWHDISDDIGFEEAGIFELGDLLERDGIPLERIVLLRRFDRWSTSYYEPSDRFTVCKGLHRERPDLWHDPLDQEPIVRGESWPDEGDSGNWCGAWIKIRQAELRDYLAARKSGLLVVRFFDRGIWSRSPLGGLPDSYEKRIESGTYRWGLRRMGEWLCSSEIQDRFWIPPADKTRWHGGSPEDEEPILFMLHGGSRVAYEEGGENDRYWEPITFNLDGVRRMKSRPGCSFEMGDLTQGILRLRNGGFVRGVVTEQAQFQCMFVDVHRGLNIAQQEELAGHCEVPRQERKYSDDWIKSSIDGQFPETRPVSWTIRTALREINDAWRERFDQALLEDPEDDELAGMMGATGPDMDCLVDEMLDLNKAVIPERCPTKVKTGLGLAKLADNAQAYEKMRCISTCRLVLRHYLGDEDSSRVLACINDARNIKGHRGGRTVEQLLEEYGLPRESPRAAYLAVLQRLLIFLGAFRGATEQALDVSIGRDENRRMEDDPWEQIEPTIEYLRHCVHALDPDAS